MLLKVAPGFQVRQFTHGLVLKQHSIIRFLVQPVIDCQNAQLTTKQLLLNHISNSCQAAQKASTELLGYPIPNKGIQMSLDEAKLTQSVNYRRNARTTSNIR